MARDFGDASELSEVTSDYLVRIVDNPNSEYPVDKLIPGTQINPVSVVSSVYGDGVADATAHIQAVITAAGADAEVVIPPGVYLLTSTLTLPSGACSIRGQGSTGQDGTVGNGQTVLLVNHAGWGISYEIGKASSGYSGCRIRDLHVKQQTAAAAAGGIFLDDSSNSRIRNVTVSDFDAGTGIRFGTAGSGSGNQYSTITETVVSDCLIGIDLQECNGVAISSSMLEGNVTTPVASSIGIKVRSGSDSPSLLAVVIQGFDTLLELGSDNASVIGCRFEGWETYGINVSGDYCSILGGSYNNSINGSVGTAINLGATSARTLVWVPHIAAAASTITNAGTLSSTYQGSAFESYLPARINALATQSLSVEKQGGGAQNPEIVLKSNSTTGPTIGTESAFAVMKIDHAYASATGLDLRIRGTNLIRTTYNGSASGIGFFGTAAQAKPTVTGSRGGNAALASLITALSTLGLLTDSSSA